MAMEIQLLLLLSSEDNHSFSVFLERAVWPGAERYARAGLAVLAVTVSIICDEMSSRIVSYQYFFRRLISKLTGHFDTPG